MRCVAILFSAVMTLVTVPTQAADKAFEGQGFDCYFQTGKQQLERIRIWYGGIQHKNDKSPQIEDASKLFVLNGLSAGNRLSYYVQDKWPDEFEIQYFQKDSGSTPLTMLSINGKELHADSYRAEIVYLPPNIAEGVSIQPTKRIGGRCTTVEAITLAAFRASAQS